MIRYALRCDRGHGFDGWFRSADGFDAMAAAGQLECAVCGSAAVSKAPMAPAVPARDEAASETPPDDKEQALAALRRHVETNSDYVGGDFASQARAMHEGALPQRSIHGEARVDEAKRLIEDGVPVAPLPFLLRRKLN